MINFIEIINNMTLAEKLAQMTQLLGDYFASDDYTKLMGLSYGFETSEELEWNIGSILDLTGAEKLKRVQDEYLKRSRHKIPLMFMEDVIHGFRTIFPSPLALACSWDQDLIEEVASISAKEAAVSGIHVTFSPMVDLVRDPRWGRVVETTGEDPYLNCLYAKAFVKGYQDTVNIIQVLPLILLHLITRSLILILKRQMLLCGLMPMPRNTDLYFAIRKIRQI